MAGQAKATETIVVNGINIDDLLSLIQGVELRVDLKGCVA